MILDASSGGMNKQFLPKYLPLGSTSFASNNFAATLTRANLETLLSCQPLWFHLPGLINKNKDKAMSVARDKVGEDMLPGYARVYEAYQFSSKSFLFQIYFLSMHFKQNYLRG